MKLHVKVGQPLTGVMENMAVGFGVTSMLTVIESLQTAEFTTSVTEYVPVAENVFEGFCKVDVLPSPKFQFQVIIVLLGTDVDRSVNVLTEPKQVFVGENAAVGF